MNNNTKENVYEMNKYENSFTGEQVSTYTPDAFLKIRSEFGCKPLTKRTPDKDKLLKQKEKFTNRYPCPYCGELQHWIEDTNLMVCKNPECTGQTIKNSSGETIASIPSYKQLNHRGAEIATTLLS